MHIKKKKHRIIFFLPVFSLGGASESLIKLSKFLNDSGFSVSLISIGQNVHKKYLKSIGCEIFELNTKRALFSIFKLRYLIKKDLEREKYSKITLISNIHYGNIISLISCFKLKNIKIILTERSSLHELSIYNNFSKFLKNRIIFFLAKKIYRYADLIIANSKYEKNYIKKNFCLKNVEHIYPPSISKIITKQVYKKKNHGIKKIIYVGNLFREKGVITIVKALANIKNNLNFIFEIYGKGYEKKTIQDYIVNNHLQNKVVFKGFCKNKINIFKNKDLLINASWCEGLPNAVIQSINYNVFPICSKSPGGNFEAIKYGKLGMTFKTNDSNDLKKKILFFFKKKIRLNKELQKIHLKNFTQKKSNEKYFKILKSF